MSKSNHSGIKLGVTSRMCIRLHLISHWLCRHRLGFPARIVQLFNRMITGADIDIMASVSPRALIPHTIGIVIGESSIVEDHVILMPHVVLGARDSGAAGRRHPRVCQGAVIGAGAVLLGPVNIGRNAKVGANAVVLEDVSPDTTVVGNPALPLKLARKNMQNQDHTQSRTL